MGLIKEPAEIDFTVLSKVWTEEEEKEFSKLLRKQKEERSKQKMRLPRYAGHRGERHVSVIQQSEAT